MYPLVCAGGGLMPYCCTQTRGGTTVGEAMVQFPPARAPSQRFGWRPSYKAAGGKGTGSSVRARAPTLP